MAAVVALGTLRHAFVARLAEWAFALMLTMFGFVLILPEERFAGAAWAAFRPVASEETMGAVLLFLGMLRLLVLAANGTWRPMYHFRALAALASAVIWFSITLGFISSGQVGVWLAIYPVLFVFDVVNVFRATGDAAAADRAARKAVRHDGAGYGNT